MNIILMIGIPGSGKSTYVDKYFKNYHIICNDDIQEVIGGEFSTTWVDYNSEKKYFQIPVTKAVERTSGEAAMKRKKSIIIDNKNIIEQDIKHWLDLADEYNYKKTAIIMKEKIDKCFSRKNIPITILYEELEKFNNIINNKKILNRFNKINIIGES